MAAPHRRQLRHRPDPAPTRQVVTDGEETEPLFARLASPSPGPERGPLAGRFGIADPQVLEGFTPLERAAFTLRHLEQQSVEDVSAMLGQNAAATRHSIFRAVAKMRRALGPMMRTDR